MATRLFSEWLLLSHFVLSLKVHTQTVSGVSFDPEFRTVMMMCHLS